MGGGRGGGMWVYICSYFMLSSLVAIEGFFCTSILPDIITVCINILIPMEADYAKVHFCPARSSKFWKI